MHLIFQVLPNSVDDDTDLPETPCLLYQGMLL